MPRSQILSDGRVSCGERKNSNSFYSWCGEPAVKAQARFSGTGFDPLCKRHASYIARRLYGNRSLVDLTPEIVEAIKVEIREYEAEKAVKAEEDRVRQEAAMADHRIRAHTEALIPHVVRYFPESAHTERSWVVVPASAAEGDRTWGVSTVKINDPEGYPAGIDIRTSSSLTLAQAIALREALDLAINTVEMAAEGFPGAVAVPTR